jgi:hypothetical protein
MILTIIELYNDTTRIQCAPEDEKTSQEVADERLAFYAETSDVLYQNLLQREVDIEIEEE